MKVNIIIPFMPFKAGGGLKVMFEYANRLASRGHSVSLYYPARAVYFKQAFIKSLLKYLLYKYRSSDVLNWFALNERVKVKCIFNISNETIEDGDIIFSTWWSLMFEISKLSGSKGKVFNLIQDIETWGGFEDKVKQSYAIAKSTNLVIAGHLYKYVSEQAGKMPLQIQIAVDEKIFLLKNPISLRDGFTVIMMYSIEPRKGSKYGLQALNELKLKYPSLKVILFSVAEPPAGLPDWIEYYKNYPHLPELYNRAAIFLSPSIQEGCALPPMEAMNCGCAVVCTDIEGHSAYAFDGETALTCKPQNVNGLAERIEHLLENRNLRIKIALQGNEFIKNYSWDASTIKLETFFRSALLASNVNLSETVRAEL